VAAAPEARDPVDPQQRDDLTQRLRTLTGNAAVTRRNVDSLQASLARSGQTIRPELLTAMARIESLIEDVQAALAASDLATAAESLTRAAYELRRVSQEVGG
jgi:hypothetical protein